MIFETLLFRCLVHGTSYSDAGKTIKLIVNESRGERALFFKLDDDMKKNCLRISGECCDCLIYFTSGNRKVLCLAELKGSDIDKAARQIINAHDQFILALGHSKRAIKSHYGTCYDCMAHFNSCEECKAILDNFTWKAFVYQRGSSPPRLDENLAKELVSRFGRRNEGYDLSRQEDVGYLLRR